jgi:hypothetical protein
MVGVRSRRRPLVTGLPLISLIVFGCVKDPQLEGETVPPDGIEQPGAGKTTIGIDVACSTLVDAETKARSALGCPDSAVSLTCPNYLFLAGSQPCDEYDEASVQACAKAMDAFEDCSEFDETPCVATVIASSCHAPIVTGGGEGGVLDSGVDAGPKAPGPDASTDGGGSNLGDAAVGPNEAGTIDAGSSVDATVAPVDAGVD